MWEFNFDFYLNINFDNYVCVFLEGFLKKKKIVCCLDSNLWGVVCVFCLRFSGGKILKSFFGIYWYLVVCFINFK